LEVHQGAYREIRSAVQRAVTSPRIIRPARAGRHRGG
jgi:hypothetical protein